MGHFFSSFLFFWVEYWFFSKVFALSISTNLPQWPSCTKYFCMMHHVIFLLLVFNVCLISFQIASFDENADVIGKVADFGLSQQVLPFYKLVCLCWQCYFQKVFPVLQHRLYSITETAPETWGDVCFYDEKSDVFSFAVVLWRLFGSKLRYMQTYTQEDEDDEFSFLKYNGKFGTHLKQREIIRNVCFLSSVFISVHLIMFTLKGRKICN